MATGLLIGLRLRGLAQLRKMLDKIDADQRGMMVALYGKDMEQRELEQAVVEMTRVFNEARWKLIETLAGRGIEDDVAKLAADDGIWWKTPEDRKAPEPPPDFEVPEAFR